MCVCLRICLWCNSLFCPPQSFSNLCPVELCIVFQWSACWDSSFKKILLMSAQFRIGTFIYFLMQYESCPISDFY